LGYADGAEEVFRDSHFGVYERKEAWLASLKCDGGEVSILECS